VTAAAGQIAQADELEIYEYDSMPAPTLSFCEWPLIELDAQGHVEAVSSIAPVAVAPPAEDFAVRLDAETRRSFEAGRERGRQEGRDAERETERAAAAEQTALRAEQLRNLMESFTAQGDAYLERAEQETVKLALAVAARILRREAQMDPLLLLGAVRVALGQLASSTQAHLHVPAGDAGLWKEAVALLPGRALKPQVIAEESMRLGDCVLETELGSADLGVRAQLTEIESGSFDRPPAVAFAGVAEERP
jgi:flagellar assembly protein FliH